MINLDYSKLKLFNNEVFDVTEYVEKLNFFLKDYLFLEDENYYIYKFNYKNRIHGLDAKGNLYNELETIYFLNDLYIIKNINFEKEKLFIQIKINY